MRLHAFLKTAIISCLCSLPSIGFASGASDWELPFPDLNTNTVETENDKDIEGANVGGVTITRPDLDNEKEVINWLDDSGDKDAGQAYPWMVVLANDGEEKARQRAFCGATLISSNWLLTSASCLYNKDGSQKNVKSIKAIFGVYSLGDYFFYTKRNGEFKSFPDDKFSYSGIEYDIERFIIHPRYNIKMHYRNDVALIKLKQHIPNSKPLTLVDDEGFDAIKNQKSTNLIDPGDLTLGSTLTAMGWGGTEFWLHQGTFEYIKYRSRLQQMETRLVSKDDCINIYKNKFNTDYIDSEYCISPTVYGSNTTCYGDEGGPILANINGDWVQVGVSVDHKYFDNGSFDICEGVSRFSSIASFRKFIEANVPNLGKDTDKPDTDKPDTDKPDTDKPDTEKPDTEKPDTDKPDTEKPDTEKPDTDKPDTDKPDTDKPDTDKPDTDKPDTDKPDTDKPDTDKPDTDKPATSSGSGSSGGSGGGSIALWMFLVLSLLVRRKIS